MSVLDVIDTGGEVTSVAAEAQIALQTGDTSRSAQLFREAGEMLESSVGRLTKASERDLARFLAATHYYKGGAYRDAARLCDRIQRGRLPSRVRHLYPPFLEDVEERAAGGYAEGYSEKIRALYMRASGEGDAGAAQSVVDLLIDHPYLFPRDRMAHMRARCCDVLGLRRATSLFYRDAWHFNPDRPYGLPLYLDSLCKEGKHAEAWRVVERELTDHPGARSLVCAMLVINAVRIRDDQRGAGEGHGGPRATLDDLLVYFDSAESAYRSLAPSERAGIALLIDFAFSIAWVAFLERGDIDKQLETLSRWIELRPDRSDPHVIRGITTHPSRDSIRDFQAAVRLGSADPWPYYALAVNALHAREFRECDRLCRLALERHPDDDLRPGLLTLRAISAWNLGRSKPDVRALFEEAKTLKPGDVVIAEYSRAFEAEMTPTSPPDFQMDGDGHRRELARRYASDSANPVLEKMGSMLGGTAA